MKNANAEIKDFVRKHSDRHGRPNVLVGFADFSDTVYAPIEDDSSFYPFTKAVSIAVALDPNALSELKDGPTANYYDEYKACSNFAEDLIHELARFLRSKGYEASVVSGESIASIESSGDSFEDAVAGPVSQRMIATHAGLGWIGKNGMIITKHFGPAVYLAAVTTDAPIKCSTEVFLSRCERCTECIKACPVEAIKMSNKTPSIQYHDMVDFDKCCQTSRKLALEKDISDAGVCGICIYACPYTKSYLRRNGLPYM